jgi:hypothetical protein
MTPIVIRGWRVKGRGTGTREASRPAFFSSFKLSGSKNLIRKSKYADDNEDQADKHKCGPCKLVI